MSDPIHDAGYVRAKVEILTEDMRAVKEDVRVIKDTMAQTKGALRFLLWISGLLAAVSAAIGAFVARHI